MEKSIYVIPDIHGRDFWNSILKVDDLENSKIIFLGDYLDPYPNERVGLEEAYKNLEEIIRLKEQYPENVTLLLGNHDLGYISEDICTCRMDYINGLRNREIFEEKMFDLVTTEKVGETNVIFSHAGIHPKWLGKYRDILGTDKEKINDLWHKEDEELHSKILYSLEDVSWYRGGFNDAGSMVWSDIREWNPETIKEENEYQIFGHTQLTRVWATEKYACIDVRKVFKVEEEDERIRLEEVTVM